jgi:hypothetical protein
MDSDGAPRPVVAVDCVESIAGGGSRDRALILVCTGWPVGGAQRGNAAVRPQRIRLPYRPQIEGTGACSGEKTGSERVTPPGGPFNLQSKECLC